MKWLKVAACLLVAGVCSYGFAYAFVQPHTATWFVLYVWSLAGTLVALWLAVVIIMYFR